MNLVGNNTTSQLPRVQGQVPLRCPSVIALLGQLLPVIFYLDGATTGQFSALSIEALKFSLGIFTRKARQKDHMWRILGYIPQVTQHKSRGRRVTIDSNHVDSVMAHPDALNDEGLAENNRRI